MEEKELKFTGKIVLSGGGRFVHRAANEERTVCGKPITRLASFPDGDPDCYTCQRRSDRR